MLRIHPTTISWTRSHPETRIRDRRKWSDQDWGIFIADQVAEGVLDILYTFTENLTFPLQLVVHNYSLPQLLRSLQISATYHWTHKNTSLPVIYHPKSLWPSQDHAAYLTNRDANYSPGITQRPGCALLGHLPWHDRSYALASKAFQMGSASVSTRASMARLLWDWVVTGRKQVLWNPSASGHCPTCSQAEDLRHILAACPHKELHNKRLSIRNACLHYIDTLHSLLATAKSAIPQPPAVLSLPSIIRILNGQILTLVSTHHEDYQLLLGSFSPVLTTTLLPLIPIHIHMSSDPDGLFPPSPSVAQSVRKVSINKAGLVL